MDRNGDRDAEKEGDAKGSFRWWPHFAEDGYMPFGYLRDLWPQLGPQIPQIPKRHVPVLREVRPPAERALRVALLLSVPVAVAVHVCLGIDICPRYADFN